MTSQSQIRFAITEAQKEVELTYSDLNIATKMGYHSAVISHRRIQFYAAVSQRDDLIVTLEKNFIKVLTN